MVFHYICLGRNSKIYDVKTKLNNSNIHKGIPIMEISAKGIIMLQNTSGSQTLLSSINFSFDYTRTAIGLLPLQLQLSF